MDVGSHNFPKNFLSDPSNHQMGCQKEFNLDFLVEKVFKFHFLVPKEHMSDTQDSRRHMKKPEITNDIYVIHFDGKAQRDEEVLIQDRPSVIDKNGVEAQSSNMVYQTCGQMPVTSLPLFWTIILLGFYTFHDDINLFAIHSKHYTGFLVSNVQEISLSHDRSFFFLNHFYLFSIFIP